MKFDVIYADPPWSYHVYHNKGKGRCAEHHYRTMKPEDIYCLDVAGVAADDCVLFLWVTFPCLQEGLEAIRRWGFAYKTLGFCWVKRNKRKVDTWFWGLGFWTRANPEICLIATRGKPKRLSKSVHCIVDTPIEVHSKKPTEVRRRIEQLMGSEGNKLELFARQKTPGWVCLGNEIDGADIRKALQAIKTEEVGAAEASI